MFDFKNIDASLILEHVSGAIAIDMAGVIVYINEKSAIYHNIRIEQALGQKVQEVLPHTKMLDGLKLTKPESVFYNSPNGVSVCIQSPLYQNGQQIGLLEYDAVRGSELQNDFTDSYILFLEEEISHLRHVIKDTHDTKYSAAHIWGGSPVVLKLKEKIANAASSQYPVLIEGEAGTGKELAANAIHEASGRRNKNFVRIHYAELTKDNEEAELFGSEENSSISTVKDVRKGKLELASQGTLFIDEIDKFPYALQASLYHTLSKGALSRVGGEKKIPIDVKLIASTNQNLGELVKEGRFHERLLKKLAITEIHVPALRYRLDDLPDMTSHIIEELNTQLGTRVQSVSKVVLNEFRRYPWPGNVKELSSVIEQAMHNTKKGILELEDFDFKNGIFGGKSYTIYDSDVDYNLIEEAKRRAEREMITAALKKFNNNKSKTAAYLEIARPLLYQKMERLGIKR